MAISVGDAVLKLGVDTKDLDRGMKSIGATIKKHQRAIGLGMVAAGGAILAAGALSIKTFAEMGDEIAKMARKTGITTETLSELRHAAELSGTSLTGLEKAMKRMATAIGDAQDGLTETIRDFDKLGVSVEELEGLSPEEAFLKLGQAIADIEDPLVRANVAQGIFGRAGMDLIPVFDQGAEALKGMRQEAHDLGIVFDEEAAKKAEEFTDALHRVSEATSGVKMAIAEQLIPVLLPLIDKVKNVISSFSAWAKEHPTLTKVLVIGTTAIGGLLVVLGSLLLVMPGILAAMTAFGITLSAAIWPITLVVAAIAALTAGGILLWKNWDKVVAFFKKAWMNIKIFFLEGILNVLDSLSKFTRIIPGLNKLVDSAREKISNMVDAENVKKDLFEVEEALRDTAEIIEETTEETIELTEALELNREELELQEEQLKDQLEAYESLVESVEETRKQFQFERSEAGRLRITLQDVTFALFDMGWTNDMVTKTLSELGDEADDVNAVLGAFGLTAQEVADILEVQADSADRLTDSLNAIPSEVTTVITTIQRTMAEAGISYGANARQLSEEQGMSLAAAQATIDRYTADPGAEEFAPVKGIMEDIMGFARGGIAMRPMLATIAEKQPEAVIPLDRLNMLGGVNITGNNFYVREEADIDKIGERIVAKIRLRTGARI